MAPTTMAMRNTIDSNSTEDQPISPAHSEYGNHDGVSRIEQRFDAIESHFTSFRDFRRTTETAIAALSSKVSNIESTLQSMMKMVENLDAESCDRDPPISSLPPIQVTSPILEPNPDESQLGYRSGNLNVANSDSVLKKVKMPYFSGKQPSNWISEAERFFHVGSYNDVEKLAWVGLYLKGKAQDWYYWELKHKGFKDWSEFKRRLVLTFSEAIVESPGKRLSKLKQRGTVSDYITEFRKLSSLLPHVNDESLIDIFYHGLSTEMQAVIRMKEPKSLEQHISAVLPMESSAFCKVVSEIPGRDSIAKQHKPTTSSSISQVVVPFEQRSGQNQVDHKRKETESVQVENANSIAEIESIGVAAGSVTAIGCVVQPQIATVLEEELFSQHEAFETGSLLQKGEAVGVNELLVKKMTEESSLERESHQTEATFHSQSVTVSTRVYSQPGLDVIPEKSKTHQLDDKMFLRRQKRQGMKKRRMSPKSWMFKFKHRADTKDLQSGFANVSEIKSTYSHLWHRWKNKIGLLQYVSTSMPSKVVSFRFENGHGFSGFVRDYREEVELFLVIVERQSFLNRTRLIPTMKCEMITWSPNILKITLFIPEMKFQQQWSSTRSFAIILLRLSLRSSFISTEGVFKSISTCLIMVDVQLWLLSTESEFDILKRNVSKQGKKKSLFTHLLHILIQQEKQWNKLYKSRMFKYKRRSIVYKACSAITEIKKQNCH